MAGIKWWSDRPLRAARLGLVGLGVAIAVTVGACGSDDEDSCAYTFTSVPDLASCELLQDEFLCANLNYIVDAQECNLNTCDSCEAADEDWDGDFDFDGDIDVDVDE